jgi:hypothetical protein
MVSDPVRWSDDVDEVMKGDLTAAVAYLTPAGGAVVTAISTLGNVRRDAGQVAFTTSLGFPRKLERILADPHVALAFHAREHGFSASPAFVLAQGGASVDLQPRREQLDALLPNWERYLGKMIRGPVWDRLLHEYYFERVFVDITIERIVAWPDLNAAGAMKVTGPAWPGDAKPQQPPRNGTGPRVDVDRVAARIAKLPHRVLAFQGADGFPVVVPVAVDGHDPAGLRLGAAPGLLPPGGRRAGLLTHAYRPQLVGLATRTCTGWLEVADDGSALYAPHTAKGFVAPPLKRPLLISNGLFAKVGFRQARRQGTIERLEQLAGEKSHQ